MGDWDLTLLPDTGFVVDGIALGFVYLTNSKTAFMDGFMADPDASKKDRSDALDVLLTRLFDEARRHGCRAVAGVTSAQPLANRLARHGFHIVTGWYAAREVNK